MADAGWYPDPQDADWEAYFDGQNWTSHRRMRPSVPPPPPPAWQLPPAGPPAQWPPPAPAPRRRKPVLIALAAAVLAAAGVTVWLVWPSNSASLTFGGKRIDAASDVLLKAEANLRSLVHGRHGVEGTDAHCYFTKPRSPKAGVPKNDVTDHLVCGPVLFVDGDPAKEYLEVALTSRLSGDRVTLSPRSDLTGLEPAALDSSLLDVRPDGTSPPSGTGGLKVPQPPPAAANIVTLDDLGPARPPTSPPHDAEMIGKTVGVRLDAAGEVPRYGHGDDARSAPRGQHLLAFQFSRLSGEVNGLGTQQIEVVVNGGRPRIAPEAVSGDEWDIVAVPDGGSAVLELKDGGITQTLSLPDGKPGADNLLVLTRTNTFVSFPKKTATVQVRYSDANGSATDTWTAMMTFGRLEFWDPYYSRFHASDGRHALLFADLIYRDTFDGKVYGFEPGNLRLVLPNGQVIHAQNVAPQHKIKNVFEVPATFTHGTIKITGSAVVGTFTVSIQQTVSFPISFARG